MSIPLIYVAGPYRAATREGVELNIQSAKAVAREMIIKGWYPVTPHMNTAHMEHIVDADDKFYLDGTLELMSKCAAVVLCAGWQRSEGTLAEIQEAKNIGLPIFYTAGAVPSVEVDNA